MNPYDQEPQVSKTAEVLKGLLMALAILTVPVALIYGLSRVSGNASTAEALLTVIVGVALAVFLPALLLWRGWLKAADEAAAGGPPVTLGRVLMGDLSIVLQAVGQLLSLLNRRDSA